MADKMKHIISCSRRSDIPAFYYNWLQKVLSDGKVDVPNPRYSQKPSRVSLDPRWVHSIVLWSKNYRNVAENPMHLDNYNLYFQYSINNYSRTLEPHVPEYKDTLRILEHMLKRYRPVQFNIRFDPILISTKGEIEPTPEKPGRARLNAFETLCRDISSMGMHRVTTSFVSLYGAVGKRLIESNIDMVNLSTKHQIMFVKAMVDIAVKYGISLYSCSSPLIESVEGIKKSSCIDGALLESIFGLRCGKVSKQKASKTGQRPDCGCTKSREIGIYKEHP